MHDIWNPWHGCIRCSEGCDHCYMYYLDAMRDQVGSNIRPVPANSRYPLQRDRNGSYKIRSGEQLRVCMTSDFFLEEADAWRPQAWDMMWQRKDVIFFLLTKRPQRVMDCLPPDWGNGWDNVFFNVTCENQRRADERIPLLLELPFKHKGIMCAPYIGPVSIKPWIGAGQIEQVICGGENYGGARPCHYEWVKNLYDECAAADIRFCFIETGTQFVKDGKLYHIDSKQTQSRMAYRSGLRHEGKQLRFKLTDSFGLPVPPDELYQPYYGKNCEECGSRMICNGCSRCGKCRNRLCSKSNKTKRQKTGSLPNLNVIGETVFFVMNHLW